MKLWLDDIRLPPDASWTWAKSAHAAIALLRHPPEPITEMSFDHDLGHTLTYREYTGYDVACVLEELARDSILPRVKWRIHSANPIGRQRIAMALKNADKYWDIHEH